jgi:hypothetical protein
MMADRPDRNRRGPRLRWKVVGLLGPVAVVALGWFLLRLHRAGVQRQAVEAITKLGGSVFYNCQYDGQGHIRSAGPPGANWLRNLLGADFFGRVDGVVLVEVGRLERLGNFGFLSRPCPKLTDAGLVHLETLSSLQWLVLSNARVGDAGLAHLERLVRLERLWLDGTQVTKEGVDKLKQALPGLLRVDWAS